MTTLKQRFESLCNSGTEHGGFLTNPNGKLDEARVLSFIESECDMAKGEAIDEVQEMAAGVFDPAPFAGEALTWHKRLREDFFSKLASLTHTKL